MENEVLNKNKEIKTIKTIGYGIGKIGTNFSDSETDSDTTKSSDFFGS